MLGLLTPLAGLLGLEIEGLGQRLKGLAIVYAVIAVFGIIGAVFLLVAGYIALAGAVGALNAALFLAGGSIAISLLTLIGLSISESNRRRRMVERRRSSDAGAFLTTAALSALPMLSRSPWLFKLGVPAAAIAAIALMKDRDDRGS